MQNLFDNHFLHTPTTLQVIVTSNSSLLFVYHQKKNLTLMSFQVEFTVKALRQTKNSHRFFFFHFSTNVPPAAIIVWGWLNLQKKIIPFHTPAYAHTGCSDKFYCYETNRFHQNNQNCALCILQAFSWKKENRHSNFYTQLSSHFSLKLIIQRKNKQNLLNTELFKKWFFSRFRLDDLLQCENDLYQSCYKFAIIPTVQR